MKHLLITDTHFHNFRQFATGTGTNNSRLINSLKVIDEAVQLCLEQDIRHVIHMGDVYHHKFAARYDFFNPVYHAFRKFKLNGIELTIIVGNHDRADDQTLTIGTYCDIARIVTTPIVYRNLLLVPYTEQFEELENYLYHFDPLIVLGHLDVIGAEVSSGWVCSKGIGREIFDRFKWVFLGHYHKHQMIGRNIEYIGCTIPQRMDEVGQPGVFVILDDEKEQVTVHQNCAPIFKVLDPRQTYVFNEFRNCYVKVLSEPNPQNDELLRDIGALAWIYAPEAKKVHVIERQKGISVDANLEEVVRTYGTIHAGQIPLEPLIETGLKCLQG